MRDAHFAVALLLMGKGYKYKLDILALAVVDRSLALLRGFCDLVGTKNMIAATPLVRCQLDNGLRFFASTLVEDPHDFAGAILKGVFVRKMKDKGGKLMQELNVLRDVSEGWFIDYKSQPLSAKDFGKHLSAFANQFGGWLFVGVQEEPQKNLKAGSFPGIPTSDVGAVLVQVREGVSAHVSPSFYFDHRFIDGPVDSIGLEAGKSIIVVSVPEGPNPPFVHSSGKIYRRIADSSEPKAETDRAVLDAMWRKSEDLRNRLREFVLKPLDNSRLDASVSYIYLMEDMTLSLPDYNLDLAGFKASMSIETGKAMSIPLDNIYATQDGFIARHFLFQNDPLGELVSLRWWRNGNVRLTIPLNRVHVPPLYLPVSDPLLCRFVDVMKRRRKDYHWILSLDQWLVALLTLTGRYLDLRDKLKSTEHIFGKVVFSKVRSCTPFIGMESYLKVVEQFGIPVAQDSVAMYPPGEANAVVELVDSTEQDTFQGVASVVMRLAINGMRALGVMFDVDMSNPVSVEQFGHEFDVAVKRGAEQGRRQAWSSEERHTTGGR